MAWAGRHPLVDAVLPPAGPVMSSEPVLGGAEGLSPSAKVIWDLARVYLSQNPALSSAPMAGAAIGVPGGAARTIPRPQPIDLRKLANDYARFVMGKAPAPLREPDPQIIRQLESLGQRATAAPGVMASRVNTEYSQGVPVPTNRPIQVSTENMGTYEMGIPNIRSMGSSFSYPMLSLKSEAWPPPGRTYLNQEFQAILNALSDRGLWP